MIKLLLNSEVTRYFGNEIMTLHYLFEPGGIEFSIDAEKLKFSHFILKIQRNEYRELLNLQLEFRNLPQDKLRQICCSFGEDLYSEDFLKLNRLILRFTLDDKLIKKHVKYKFRSVNQVEEIFDIEDFQGEKIILNLNNYKIDKVFDL